MLKETHTKVLLDWLNSSRKFEGEYSPITGITFTTDEIKAELATREHVPNKQEAKEIRREKAKRQRTK